MRGRRELPDRRRSSPARGGVKRGGGQRRVASHGAGARRRRRGGAGSLRGRGTPEKVTRGASRAASAGPTPRTRCSSSSEPYAPCSARSARIRAARPGPIPGSDSSAAESARSTSTVTGGAGTAGGGRCGRARFRAPARGARAAESAARSCRSSAPTVSPVPAYRVGDGSRTRRTPAPSRASAARKRSAFDSAGVGTADVGDVARPTHHRSGAAGHTRTQPTAAPRLSAGAPWPRRPRSGATSRSPG